MEGVAILSAVLAVATVTATNDYSKDQQFRALNKVKEDIAVTVSHHTPFHHTSSISMLCTAALAHASTFLFVPPLQVRRDHGVSQVSVHQLVVGDIVVLESGDRVPADCVLLEGFDITSNESSLTGTSPCHEHQGTKQEFGLERRG